jgi:hypothetical protein
MKALLLIILILFTQWSFSIAQRWDLDITRGADKIEIPFEFENNFIIIKLLFNGAFPLKFIFDTGAEHTILTKREITDLLAIPYQRRFTIVGSDMQTELYAYLVRNINLRINNADFKNRSMLVLEEDYFEFEQMAGVNVQGIIGSDMFRRFVVQIDYRAQKIILHDPSTFQLPKNKYIEHPLQISRHKPYLYTCTHFHGDTIVPTKLLLDTGASLALLLYTDTHPDLHLPPEVIPSKIGMGLGGSLQGFLGRVERIDLAGFTFSEVTTNFQDLYPIIDSTYTNDRNGIIGNQLLSRFVVIIDYVRSRLYLQPQRNYKEAFKFDRSGMLLAATGPHLNDFTVYQVIPGSPADEAGVLSGDIIKTINGLPANFFSLDDISRKLRRKIGKRIKLKIERDGEVLKIRFRLRELI